MSPTGSQTARPQHLLPLSRVGIIYLDLHMELEHSVEKFSEVTLVEFYLEVSPVVGGVKGAVDFGGHVPQPSRCV